jgi:hypothetical protein
MMATPAVQAEVLRAAATGEEAIAEAIGERVGIDPAKDIYPRLVAAAVTAAFHVTSRQVIAESGNDEKIHGLLTDALRQIAAGLPPPQR